MVQERKRLRPQPSFGNVCPLQDVGQVLPILPLTGPEKKTIEKYA